MRSNKAFVTYLGTITVWLLIYVGLLICVYSLFSFSLISYQTLLKVVGGAFVIWLSHNAWYALDCNSTEYIVDEHFVKINVGILNRRSLSYDMTKIKEVELYRPLHYRIFGKASLILDLKQPTDEVTLDGIDLEIAKEMFNTININAVENITELIRKKDLLK